MRKALVRNGDPTTTGGVVSAKTSNRSDGGKPIALHGEEATCGNCVGTFKIFGTCTTATYRGRASVFDGDPVLCPCGKNRVIAGSDARCFAESGNSPSVVGHALSVDSDEFKSRMDYINDEQVRVAVPGVALDGYPYLVEAADGRYFSGRVGKDGLLPRVATDGVDEYTVHWGDSALSKKE